jgi:hypothetical protein
MMAPLAMHIHASVHIYVDGQPIVIPANVGVFGLSAYPLHTHDATGLIHMESPVVRDFHLQDFLAVWNTTAQGHAALTELDAARDLTVTVNGMASAGLGLVLLHDHDDIIIKALSANPSAAATANEMFLARLYTDLLQRTPDTVGLVGFATALDQGMSRTQAAQVMEASGEFHSLQVQGLYRSLLHRDVDPSGLAGFNAFLAAGGTSAQVSDYLLASPEYFQRAGGTDAGFVAALYSDLLHRAPEATGAAAWQALLAGGQTRARIAAEMLQTEEAQAAALHEIYQEYLHRPADDFGLSHFLAFLHNGGTREQAIAIIVGSAEYMNRA